MNNIEKFLLRIFGKFFKTKEVPKYLKGKK